MIYIATTTINPPTKALKKLDRKKFQIIAQRRVVTNSDNEQKTTTLVKTLFFTLQLYKFVSCFSNLLIMIMNYRN